MCQGDIFDRGVENYHSRCFLLSTATRKSRADPLISPPMIHIVVSQPDVINASSRNNATCHIATSLILVGRENFNRDPHPKLESVDENVTLIDAYQLAVAIIKLFKSLPLLVRQLF